MSVIVHNMLAMNAQRQFGINTKQKAKNTEKLSSGYKVNRASDDAAGLSISEKMRNQIRNLNQGISNTEDAIYMCKLGDGALNEVENIIHRMKELSVHSANDILDDDDRKALDEEYQLLKEEINKIGNDTQFNGRYLFCGNDVEIGPEGTTFGDVSIDQVELGFANVRLVEGPFSEGSSAQTLKCAVKTSEGTSVSGTDWNLIYGSGNTSYTSLRVGIVDENGNIGNKKTININDTNMRVSDYQYNESQNTWSRKLSYDDGNIKFNIEQKVKVAPKVSNSQYYEISYTFNNNSGKKLAVDFMYNCDTAYNNNDQCEGYFVDNQRITSSILYSRDNTYTSQGNANVISTIPDSFSIFNQQNALQFTEKICVDTSNRPDTLSLGRWTRVDQWSYYENLNSSLGQDLGSGEYGEDLAFSMIWSNKVVDAGSNQTFGLKQGIAASATDNNVSSLPVTLNDERLTRHDTYNPLWIQSGANSGEDLQIIFEEMNCDTIGLRGSAVDPIDKAIEAMEEVEEALKAVNSNRSKIGAQQNRLEYTVEHEMNYSENLTGAESNIRDTDMGKEMVDLSKNDILQQAAQSMIAQANQQNQGILQLIQS